MEKPKVYSYARFSSASQAKGYSLERQEKRAQEWAEKMGLSIEESHSDQGLSGYHGDHLKTGSLGRFLVSVEAGRIPTGSYLLVEQFDRLSRQNLHKAQGLIWRILDAGITIVTLATGKKYSKAQGLGGAIEIIVALEASYQESDKKADRLRESWSKRLEKAAQGQVISKACPGWMKATDKGFELIPDHVSVVRKMFTLADEGMGVQAIATRLNEANIPTWKKSGVSWAKATIHKILSSKASLGILERKITAKPGDKPTVKEIPGYYHPIIELELWHRVQKSLRAKTNKGGSQRAGRKGAFRNLFGDVAVCGYCGGRMTTMDAGTGPNGAKWRHWMVCRNARMKLDCKYYAHPYPLIEQAILDYSTEIGYEAILSGGDMETEITQAKEKVKGIRDSIKGKEAQLGAEISLAGKVTNDTLVNMFATRLDSIQAEIDSLNAQLEEAMLEESRLSRSGQTVADHLDTIKRLRDSLSDPNEAKMIESRRLTRLAVTESVELITVFPNGLQGRELHFTDAGIKALLRPTGFTAEAEAQLEELLPVDCSLEEAKAEILQAEQDCLKDYTQQTTGKDKAVVTVRFRNGHSRVFAWDAVSKSFIQTNVETKDYAEFNGIRFENVGGRLQITNFTSSC